MTKILSHDLYSQPNLFYPRSPKLISPNLTKKPNITHPVLT